MEIQNENQQQPANQGQRQLPAVLSRYQTQMIYLIFVMGGLLVGYSGSILGGLVSMDYFRATFFAVSYDNQVHDAKKFLHPYGDFMLASIISAHTMVCILAYPLAWIISTRFNRWITMTFAVAVAMIGTLVTDVAKSTSVLYVGRSLTVFGVGCIFQVINMVASLLRWENTLIAYSFLLGVFFAKLTNVFTSSDTHYGWIISNSIMFLPEIILLVSGFLAYKRFQALEDRFPTPGMTLIWPSQTLLRNILVQILGCTSGYDVVLLYMPVFIRAFDYPRTASLLAPTISSGFIMIFVFVFRFIMKNRADEFLLLRFGIAGLLLAVCQFAIMVILYTVIPYSITLVQKIFLGIFILLFMLSYSVLSDPRGVLNLAFDEEDRMMGPLLNQMLS